MIVCSEVPFHHTVQHHCQHDRTHRHMEAVESRQHEESRSINTGCQLQVQILISVNVLIRLEAHKDRAEQNGSEEPEGGLAAIANTDGMMRNRQSDAGQQQQRSIDGRNPEWSHGLEILNGACRTGIAPLRRKIRPQNLVIKIGEPRHRHATRIKQCPKKTSKEHHFGKDEPTHAPAVRYIDALAVQSAFRFRNRIAEPFIQHHGQRQNTGNVGVRAPRIAIHPGRCPRHCQQQCCACQYRPLGRPRHEVIRRLCVLRIHLPLHSICCGWHQCI